MEGDRKGSKGMEGIKGDASDYNQVVGVCRKIDISFITFSQDGTQSNELHDFFRKTRLFSRDHAKRKIS